MAISPTRLCTTAVSAVTFLTLLSLAVPAMASSTRYRTDWDAEWLRQTGGGFAYEYFYDPTSFYSTLPSRARSFALHSYHRQSYYKTYHGLPPPPGYTPPPTPRQLAACDNYTFERPDRVPPFGYECR